MNDQMMLKHIEAQIKESKIYKEKYIYIIYNKIQLFFYIQYNKHYIFFIYQIFVPYIYLKSLLTVSNNIKINIIYYNYNKHIQQIYLTI